MLRSWVKTKDSSFKTPLSKHGFKRLIFKEKFSFLYKKDNNNRIYVG